MLKDIKLVFLKPAVKNVILALFTIEISVIVGMLGTWNSTQSGFCGKIAVLIISVIVYFFALIKYTTAEVNQRKSLEVLGRQLKTSEELLISIASICETNASNINSCIRRVNETKNIDLGIWSFRSACRNICSHIYQNICSLSNCQKYGVAYIKLIEDGEDNGKIKMYEYANQGRKPPSIYDKVRQFKDVDLKTAYHDAQLFFEGKSDIDIRKGVNEVDEVFLRGKGKYHLYIGIPVFCDNKKMIGLLEVVGLDETMLGCTTKEELEEVANKYLVPYANIFLLMHKMEKALLVGTSKSNSDE